MNSSKSMVPSPLTSYSITNPRISSSVGFWPIDLNTGKSSFVVMVPLPSYNNDIRSFARGNKLDIMMQY